MDAFGRGSCSRLGDALPTQNVSEKGFRKVMKKSKEVQVCMPGPPCFIKDPMFDFCCCADVAFLAFVAPHQPDGVLPQRLFALPQFPIKSE